MTGSPYHLEALAPGVYAWLADNPSTANPNAGVIIADDGLTVVDALTTSAQATPLADEVSSLTSLPVRRLVYTSSHLGQVGGSAAFPLAAVYGSGQTSHHLDQPADPEVLRRLHPAHPDAGDPPARPVTHTVTEAAYLCPASIGLPTGGHQFENLVVQVPAAGVVFCGAMASFGVVPIGFDADVERWITELESISQLGTAFVPSYGTPGAAADLDALRAYLEAVDDAAGRGSTQLGPGPWDEWEGSIWTPINIERAAGIRAGDPAPPLGLQRLLS